MGQQVLWMVPSRRTVMAGNESFGMNPEDLDRLLRGASEQLRGALGQFGRLADNSGGRSGWSGGASSRSQPAPETETTGKSGDGVWAIYTVDDAGGAQVEQVYATELDALRANKHNTDSKRRVRFLPYGIAVSVLDAPEAPGNEAS
jgi:hypothetical protein